MNINPDAMLLLKLLEPYSTFDEVALALRLQSIAWMSNGRTWFAFPNWTRINFWNRISGFSMCIATLNAETIRVRAESTFVEFPLHNALKSAMEYNRSCS